MTHFYNDRDHEEYNKRIEALGIDAQKLSIVENPNISVQHYRKTSGFRYTITIGNANYICCGYDEIKLTIPAPTTWDALGKVWNGIAATVDIASMLIGEGPLLPLDSSKCDTCEITVVRLLDEHDDVVVDAISNEDKAKITQAMKRSKNQCSELHNEGTIGMQILKNYHSSHSTHALSIEDLHSVTNQFSNQDNEYRQKMTADKAREKARRKREKARRKEEAKLAREAFLLDVKMKKAKHSVEITTDFHDSGLLRKTALSNNEKLKEYSALRNFCKKYIPALADRTFQIESLYEKYPDYFSERSFTAFRNNWTRISRSYNVLKRGVIGEEKVAEVLRLFDDRARILRDFTWGHEHDFIIITPYGISTIEVKNLYGQYVLTETGILRCTSSSKVKPKDVALQSKKHLETLRRNLKNCPAFSADVPLQEIICSAEPNFTIQDDYHYIPVCYYNTVDKVLFPESGQIVLSDEEMDEIQKYLLDNQHDSFRFDVFLPRGEIDSREAFIESFVDIAGGLLAIQDNE